jgi:hypothetical protein
LIRINLGDLVRVKLTPFGEMLLGKEKIRLYTESGGSDNPGDAPINARVGESIWSEHEADREGYRRFQLFELMRIFGPVLTTEAQQVPFVENSIMLLVHPGE